MVDVAVREGGSGEPVLLLIHGLGATGRVWDGCARLLDHRWPGRWVAPDLPGHGASARLSDYTFPSMATALTPAVAGAGAVVVLGHSLGGVLGLLLADGSSGVPVRTVVALGVKVEWAPAELDRARAIAARPMSSFGSRGEAAERYLRVSGLAGLLAADHPAVDSGLGEQHGRWRLAMDPATFGVGAPDMPRLLAAARADVVLARGERDPMNTDEQYARLGVPRVTLAGLGHNAHVEDPRATLALLDGTGRPG
jgi:pimeloyl-ACP methyl ester carboxylesterase